MPAEQGHHFLTNFGGMPLPSKKHSVSNDVAAGLMPVSEALARIKQGVSRVASTEMAPLHAALGRVLAKDQRSTLRVPAFDNAAVDGWAANSADLSATEPVRIPIGGRIAAGHPLQEPPKSGQVYRIFTGAPVPPELNIVLAQEACQQEGDQVLLPQGQKPGINIRKAGESVGLGQTVLQAGVRLGPQHIGVAASIGLQRLPIRRRLRVAIFSNGDELREPGQRLKAGCLFDANRYSLVGMLTGLGCVVSDLGILPDEFTAIRDAVIQAVTTHDLVITSGGVSVGAEDHVKSVLRALGQLHLWRLAVKPGKPLAFGEIQGVPFLGLPGNPVAAMVSFCLFARPLIDILAGALPREPRRYFLPAAFAMAKAAGLREYPRARIVDSEFGPVVRLFPRDSSAILTSMTEADGLIELPEAAATIGPGDMVAFLPFSEMMV